MKCLNKFNDFYLKEFNSLIHDAREKNNKNLMLIYKKVTLSIQKYPFPILTPSQAMAMEGVGESISKMFEKLINSYKTKIEEENINYIELAYNLNKDTNDKKKTRKRKNEPDIELNKSNLKSRKKLSNIDQYSPAWTAVVSSYILYIQTNSVILEIDDVLAMARTIVDELASVMTIEMCENKDFRQLRNLDLIENMEAKSKNVKINEFLIKLAKLELKKSGIVVENDEQGALNFSLVSNTTNDPFSRMDNNMCNNTTYSYSQNTNNNTYSQNDNNSLVLYNETQSQTYNSGSTFNNNNISNTFKTSKTEYNKANTKLTDNFLNSQSTSKSTLDTYISNNNIIIAQQKEHMIIDTNNNDNKHSQQIKSGHELSQLYKSFKERSPNNNMYNITLLIDNRERGPNGEVFKDEIKNKSNIKCEERNLSLGDFCWIYTDPDTDVEYILDFIIERKTLSDLADSIVDGRYTEQKYRLKNTKISNVYYIFEGTNYVVRRNNITKQALNTAIYNTVNIHNINIFKAGSIDDTVNFLIQLDKYVKKYQFNKDNLMLYDEFTQNNAKTKNSSLENIFIRQLRCVIIYI